MASVYGLLRTLLARGNPTSGPQPFRRTPVGFILHWGSIAGSAYCTVKIFEHYVLTWGHSMGESMFPTIPSEPTVSIYSRLNRNGKNLAVGDIVHAKNPLFPRQLVGKRIIGMPGDYVLRDEHLAPSGGGAAMPPIVKDGRRTEPVMIQVPEGHVWLAGDNMARSRDSRFYGPVPLAMIEGKTLYSGDGWFSWTSFRGDQLKRVEDGRENEHLAIALVTANKAQSTGTGD